MNLDEYKVEEKDYQTKYFLNERQYSSALKVEKIGTQDLFIKKVFRINEKKIDIKSHPLIELQFLVKAGIDGMPFAPLAGFSLGNDQIEPFIMTKYMEKRDLMMIIDNRIPIDLSSSWEKASIYKPDNDDANLPPLDSNQVMKIIYGVAFGIQYMHRNKIVHGDIHPSNILFDNQCNPLISDFIYTKDIIPIDDYQINQENKKRRPYIAPEVFNNKELDLRSDVYSFAVIVLHILTSKLTFKRLIDPFSVDQRVFLNFCKSSNIYDIPSQIPDDFAKLLQSCLSHNPDDRKTIDEFIQYFDNEKNLVTFGEYLKFDIPIFKDYVQSLKNAQNNLDNPNH